MERASSARRLIVNADDFGASSAINRAVIRAHREGILTTASLMVNGDACTEAVELARENPRLGVGLHLTACFGRSTLGPGQIPNLVDGNSMFSFEPAAAGMKYFFSGAARRELGMEVVAQVEKFRSFRLPLDHINGHLHFHLHPVIFNHLLGVADWEQIRITREPLFLNLMLQKGNLAYRCSHSLIFRLLSRWALHRLRSRPVRFTREVFGLLQNGLVDENYILSLLPHLRAGASELYSHPSLDSFKHEFEGLISPRVAGLVRSEEIELIRYQDL